MKLQLTPDQSSAFAVEAGAYTDLKDSSSRVLTVFRAHNHQPFTRKDVESVVVAMGCPIPEPFKAKDPVTGKLGWQVFYPLAEEHGLEKASRTYYKFGEGSQAPIPQPVEAPVAAPAPTPVAEAAPEPVEPVEAPVEPETLPEPVEPEGPGVAWVPPVLDVDAGYYAEDEGLRRMAVSQSLCFGNYSDEAKACERCPLAAFCAPASMSAMADIAAALDEKAEKAMKPAPKPKPTPKPAAPPLEDLLDEKPAEETGGDYPEDSQEMETPFDTFCSACRGDIPEGTVGVHVGGKGMMHPACARKLV